MWVYGDRVREADPRAVIAGLRRRLSTLDAPGPAVERHARRAALFIAAAELAQGLADAAFERDGADGRIPEGEAATGLLTALASEVLASWAALGAEVAGEDGVVGRITPSLDRLAALDLPGTVRLKTAEGHAYYALYPEAYAAAAAELAGAGPHATVIGVRSIGLGLAAVAAETLGAPAPLSVRPVGHPFRRELKLRPELEAELRARGGGRFVVVDEGPGLSGSSFGAVADALERRGAERSRIAFLPGHGGDLGPEASGQHRARWAQAQRPSVGMDALIVHAARPAHRLERWFDDLSGGEGRLEDLSGGAWRARRPGGEADWPAADAAQERRKWRLQGRSGCWMLKFHGLGAHGERSFEAARRLGEAGWSPPTAALRYGVGAFAWVETAGSVRPTSAFVAHLGRYIGWRATHLEAPEGGGATLPELREMLWANAAEAFGPEAAVGAPALDPARWSDAPPLRRIWTDNRLHVQEWLATADGGWLKTDAVDHAVAHDMVGAQDLAWDLAGARVEFGLDDAGAARLLAVVAEQAPVEPALVVLLEPAYLAFQLGLWTNALTAQAGWPEERARLARVVERYRRRLRARLLER